MGDLGLAGPRARRGWGTGLSVSAVFGALVSLWLFAIALGVAITKYRLYDIDVIINRALVYTSLAVFIGSVYVGVVVGVGSLLGSTDEPNPVLAVGATSLVAVAFQPVRRRMERVANRLVFGRKATPYEVLSEFSRRVAATSDDLLSDAARSLAEGTRADRVAVSVMVDGSIAVLDTPESLKRRFDVGTMGEVFVRLARKATRKE